jgi:hypothetical protein
MHNFVYPIKSTFISSDSELINRNMGGDEVLEIEKLAQNRVPNFIGLSTSSILYTASYSRTLLQFDISEIIRVVEDNGIASPRYFLCMKTVEATHLPREYTIYAYPITGSWINGTGRKYEDLPANGVTWLYKSPQENIPWNVPGGDLNYTLRCQQAFTSANSSDIKMDVTDIVHNWYYGLIENSGIMLLYSTASMATSSIDSGKLRYFSPNTNTIYYPYIDIVHDDSTYITGSNTVATNFKNGKVVKIKNINPEYVQGETVRLDVAVRDKYPIKTFDSWPTSSIPFNNYISTQLLPTSSYYSITDYYTKHTWIDFDDYTKISSDGTSSYIQFNTTGLPQERHFVVRIKVVENKNINIYDSNVDFKIIR